MTNERAAGAPSIFRLVTGLFLSMLAVGCDASKGACASDVECAATSRCEVPVGSCRPAAGDVDAGARQPLDASVAPDGTAQSRDAAAGSPPYYPFGSRLDGPYPFGIKVGGHTNAQMDAMVASSYDAWKSVRLKAAPTFTADSGIYSGKTITDAYFVQFGDTTYGPVSEGIGYGMLITVIMAGYDPKAQTYFDGLFKLARGRPA